MIREQRFYSTLLLVLGIALSVRIGAIFIGQIIGFNPFTDFQVDMHAETAEDLAVTILQAKLPEFSIYRSTIRWGLILFPFWLLPGPSRLYAQFGIALLSSLGIVNVFLIAKHYYSTQAGIIAALPLALLPSYFFMHSVVQREAMVLFGFTTAFVLVFLPNKYVLPPYNYLLATIFVLIPAYLRLPNTPVILATIAITIAVVIVRSNRISFRQKIQAAMGVTISGIIATIVLIQTFISDNPTEYLTTLRERRIRGRATYLEGVIPASIPESIGFSWIGAVYFLYAPFPWHVEGINDLLIMLESMVGIGFSIFAIFGVLVLKERSVPATVALVSGIVLFSVLYGFGTGNYGTGLRHRQTIFWAIYILGAIGISSKVKFKI